MFLSIIIPLASDDRADDLIKQLQRFGYEPIVVSEETRAKSLNRGAMLADGENLFFLHADTNLDDSILEKLPGILHGNTEIMYYFKLKFDRSGLFYLNSLAANLRCYFFSIPYGDQGFCISKKLFIEVGGFSENMTYGEDMYFVLKLKRLGIAVKQLPFSITTSARKYNEKGWFKVTLIHQWRFWKILYRFSFLKGKYG
jgi:GT2 family glycosyltransferase